MSAQPAPNAERTALLDAAPEPRPERGWKGILMPAVIVLSIGAIFVSVYLAAFHDPRPHHLPVAVVGARQQAEDVTVSLRESDPGGFEVRAIADRAAAEAAIRDRSIYAAFIPAGSPAQEAVLLYAGANGPSLTSAMTATFGRLAGGHLSYHDLRPSASGDSRGLSVFYAAFGLVLAGFLFGSTTYASAPRLTLRQRLLSLGLFGVAGGLVVALLTGATGYNALPGSFLGVAGLVALLGIAIGAATMALIQSIGPMGTPLSSVVLLTLGNASSASILPADYLPAWLHPLAHILPVGAGVHAIQGLSYFRNDGVPLGVTVLVIWIVVAVAILFVHDGRSRRRTAATGTSLANREVIAPT